MRIEKTFKIISSAFFPDRCPGCAAVLPMDRSGFCPDCLKHITIAKEPACKCCGRPLTSDDGIYCRDCSGEEHVFVQCKSYCAYSGPARKAMYRLKYDNGRWVGEVFAKELVREHGKWLMLRRPQAIIPVPMYPKKERVRGYNQARILALELKKELCRLEGFKDIPVVDVVRRVRSTQPQKEIKGSLRRKNLKKAFKLNRNVVKLNGMYSEREVCYQSVLVVDDIFTTGATIDTVAELLLKGRIAREVYGITAVTGSICEPFRKTL